MTTMTREEECLGSSLSTLVRSSTYRKQRMEFPTRHVEYVPWSSSTSFDPEEGRRCIAIPSKVLYLMDPRLPDLLAVHEHHSVVEAHGFSRSDLE